MGERERMRVTGFRMTQRGGEVAPPEEGARELQSESYIQERDRNRQESVREQQCEDALSLRVALPPPL